MIHQSLGIQSQIAIFKTPEQNDINLYHTDDCYSVGSNCRYLIFGEFYDVNLGIGWQKKLCTEVKQLCLEDFLRREYIYKP